MVSDSETLGDSEKVPDGVAVLLCESDAESDAEAERELDAESDSDRVPERDCDALGDDDFVSVVLLEIIWASMKSAHVISTTEHNIVITTDNTTRID